MVVMDTNLTVDMKTVVNLDVKIVFLTVKKVVVRDGISAEGEATMSKFSGDK